MFIYVCVDKDRLASFPVYLLHICISVMLSGTSLYCIQLPFWDASILFEIPYKFTSFKVPTYFSVSKLITSINVYIYICAPLYDSKCSLHTTIWANVLDNWNQNVGRNNPLPFFASFSSCTYLQPFPSTSSGARVRLHQTDSLLTKTWQNVTASHFSPFPPSTLKKKKHNLFWPG